MKSFVILFLLLNCDFGGLQGQPISKHVSIPNKSEATYGNSDLIDRIVCDVDLVGLSISCPVDSLFLSLDKSAYFHFESVSDSVHIESRNQYYRLFKTVELCGISCGMNMKILKVGNVYHIRAVTFLTSQRNPQTMEKFYDALKKVYGKPLSEDDVDWEDGYGRFCWFLKRTTIVSKNVQSENWQVSFMLP